MLKVITWNCNMAFRKKSIFIEEYAPDILIVPECEHPDKLKFAPNSKLPTSVFWYGTNLNKGLGVFSFTDYKISLLNYHEAQFKLIIPLKITNGHATYNIFAIWANNPEDRGYQYVGQVWKALNHYHKRIKKKNTLLIGDFNSNTMWDKPRREGNHTTVVNLLAEKGIESVYHRYFDQKQGIEEHPTFYLYKNKDKPYHLDYCFVSKDLMGKLKKVEVGEYERWIKMSDHVPLIMDFE